MVGLPEFVSQLFFRPFGLAVSRLRARAWALGCILALLCAVPSLRDSRRLPTFPALTCRAIQIPPLRGWNIAITGFLGNSYALSECLMAYAAATQA